MHPGDGPRLSGGAPARGAPTAANIAAGLAAVADRYPDRPAIIESARGRRRQVTFAELAETAEGVGRILRKRGIREGDRVLLFVPMSIDLYAALLGCAHAGAAAVFVDAWADRRRLDAAVRTAAPGAFIGTPRAHLLRLLSGAVRRIPVRLVAGSGPFGLTRRGRRPTASPASGGSGEGGRRRGAAGRADAVGATGVDAGAPALITFTTGSTGPPKAAARSHGFLWSQHLVLAAHLGLRDGDVDMPTLPIFVLNNLATGTPSVIPDFDPRRPADFDPAAVYGQIQAEGVTTSTGSPAFYQRLAEWCAARDLRLPLRALFTGGAPVLPPLARLLTRTVEGAAHVVYGSTEAEPIAMATVDELLESVEGDGATGGLCVGRPVPEVACRIVRPHDGAIALGGDGWAEWDVAAGEPGEVVVAGPHVLAGYLGAPDDELRVKVRDGGTVWHRTGDAARLDDRGRLRLLGRVDARVQRDGRTWWPLPAELRALEVPGVAHAAYLGLPDDRLEQRAVLCVETANGRLDAGADARLRAALEPWPVDEVRAFDRITRDPRHASKTDTHRLRRRLASGIAGHDRTG